MLTVTQLAKECPTFYAALRFITEFRVTYYYYYYYINLPSMPWSPQWSLPIRISSKNLCELCKKTFYKVCSGILLLLSRAYLSSQDTK